MQATNHDPSLKIANGTSLVHFLMLPPFVNPVETKSSVRNFFYAHPYCASERGSNENANRLIRRFLPKGTDFSSFSQSDFDFLAMWINKYPRKLHAGRSAWQLANVYSSHFNKSIA